MQRGRPPPDSPTAPQRLLLPPSSFPWGITGGWDEGDIMAWAGVTSPNSLKPPQGSDKAWAMPRGPGSPLGNRGGWIIPTVLLNWPRPDSKSQVLIRIRSSQT